MLTYTANARFYIFSPLDQFVDDKFGGLVDNMLTDLITNLWYLEKRVDFTGVVTLAPTTGRTTVCNNGYSSTEPLDPVLTDDLIIILNEPGNFSITGCALCILKIGVSTT